MSKRSGEETIVGMSAGETDTGDGPRVSYHPQIRPRYTPADLFNLPGLVWAAGQAEPQPVYAPPLADQTLPEANSA